MLKKRTIIIAITAYGLLCMSSVYIYTKQIANPVMSDVGKLLPTKIKRVENAEDEHALQKLVKDANTSGEKISIAGMQHSQGGQTYYPNGTVLDMKGYNKILEFDPEKKRIRVQSGVTWDDIQKKVNPYGLAVQVMQSQNIFTVGGSLSVNVHGRDIRHEALIDTVESFRLLMADGTVKNVSREENADLFPYVIGGYGLFGVILDVTLKLTDDELYEMQTRTLDYKEYTAYFKEKVKKDENVRMHLARISVAPNSFLKEMYVTDYVVAENQNKREEYSKLKEENIIAAPKFSLGLSRYSDWGKNTFWDIQRNYIERINGTYETRNNVMRSDSTFMEYENPNRTEVLQEYFVPIDHFTAYIDDLRNVLNKEELNLLNITIRYVEKNENAVLSYAKDDMFALVLLINQGRSESEIKKTKAVLGKMIDVTLKHNGSYYLPYYSYPTKQQLREAYPRIEEFLQKKKESDPQERFVNLFYKEYSE
ncbi:FAD-binding oxidoreductase [Bacillus pseudomycoides]|uniref:FAD-binding oxidoreductase n=1 Tax=Bacillus pseudomycoides TaxID=64104 RepID=UPI000BEF8CF2|nr:FAD-binding oxidoreductase [Bacillus pseudomycoides]PEM77497.1 FAD-binding oxidoreductase [Bacillus pseudomycoides]PGA64129.1 FAD-binding oxidoreductase [Bacillus pseudomycoides]PHA49635.1 FAD-binding oxidoreductase [Bacillus pseudomycoides]PHA65321.1 FAD-binding oxidoreductase [Bacillus pseudomycoides]